jgi:hypothetical protein
MVSLSGNGGHLVNIGMLFWACSVSVCQNGEFTSPPSLSTLGPIDVDIRKTYHNYFLFFADPPRETISFPNDWNLKTSTPFATVVGSPQTPVRFK